jgi:PIN domain nuclease of toxin-antitoxin system
MKYLLDTSVLINSLMAKPKLNDRALILLARGSVELYLSAVSSWEITIKTNTGKLKLVESASEFVTRAMRLMSLRSLDITHLHTLAVGGLDSHHRDPFDRLLIAQARLEGMTILTDDKIIQKYDVEQVYCGR